MQAILAQFIAKEQISRYFPSVQEASNLLSRTGLDALGKKEKRENNEKKEQQPNCEKKKKKSIADPEESEWNGRIWRGKKVLLP